MRTGMRPLAVLAIAVVFALALAVTGCAGGDSTGDSTGDTAGGTTVTEQSLAFSPATLQVSVGDIVTFANEDSVDHQVLIDGVTLDRQAPGESVTWTADEAGTIDYICTLHPSMMGRIVVE